MDPVPVPVMDPVPVPVMDPVPVMGPSTRHGPVPVMDQYPSWTRTCHRHGPGPVTVMDQDPVTVMDQDPVPVRHGPCTRTAWSLYPYGMVLVPVRHGRTWHDGHGLTWHDGHGLTWRDWHDSLDRPGPP